MRAGPMPGTSSRSSTDRNGPCAVRQSTIFWAVTGPIPGSSSSCSTVAVARLTLAPGDRGARESGRDASRAAARHDHLLTVDERCGEVHGREVGAPRRPARARDRVRDARALLQPEEARAADGADDVDEQLRSGVRRGVGPPHRRHDASGTAVDGPLARADAGEPRARDGEQRQERHGDHRELRAREGDHPSSVALDL